jgi:tricorn protease interacting factor F2/3
MSEKRETLGDNVVPAVYYLEVESNLKTFRFNGLETIEVNVRKPTDTIALNSAELTVKEVAVESAGAKQKAAVTFNKAKEQAILKLGKKVNGKVSISLRFSGIHNDKMYGFYRSRYAAGGKEHYLLTTHFEPADARKAFPCFDEPEMKAVFHISMVVDKRLECISNMPVKKETPIGKGKKRVSFLPTPRMSTYLVYLSAGNYDYAEGSVDDVKIRVLASKGKRHLLDMPLEYAKKFLRHYEDYFGIKYPLPKLDLLGIPDFAMGGMENWGAITFRETGLLGSEKSAVTSKQRIAVVISHEIAHQWFGDLVTMKWWDDIWLNESFADYMSYKAIDAVFPEWKMLTQYLEDSVSGAFSADQLKATRPVRMMVDNPAEMAAAIDRGITYDKGGTILRMMEDYAGPRVFRKGLHTYLKNNAYANATERNLWEAIDEASRKEGNKTLARDVAKYWIDNPGYPLVSVSRSARGYLLAQSRFIISKDEKAPSKWPIPITYTFDGKASRKLLMSGSACTIPAGDSEWVKLNLGQNGLYRIRYESDIEDRLGKAIRNGKINAVDAWGVEGDLFSFARSGRIPLTEYIDFVSDYCFDCGYPLNGSLLSHLSWFNSMLYGTSLSDTAREPLAAYSRQFLDRLGLKRKKGESNVDTMFRSATFLNLGLSGDKEISEKAARMFHSYVDGGADLDRNLRSAVYCTAAWTGGSDVFGMLVKGYRRETAPDEKLRFLSALSFFREKPLINKALEFVMSKDVRYQDVLFVPVNMSSNPVARHVLMKWNAANWKILMERYSPITKIMPNFVLALSGTSSESAKSEIVSFFSKKSNLRDDFEPELRKTLERIDTNIRFMKANGVVQR